MYVSRLPNIKYASHVPSQSEIKFRQGGYIVLNAGKKKKKKKKTFADPGPLVSPAVAVCG